MPIHTPMAPERKMVRQYFSTSSMRGTTELSLLETAFTAGPRMACSTSATP